MAGFCRNWIPNYGLIARPLYEALKGGERELLQWNKDPERAFETLKTELSSTGASKFGQALYPIYSREVRDSTRSPDPKAGTGSEASGLLFKTTGLRGPGMAKLPAGSSSYSPVG